MKRRKVEPKRRLAGRSSRPLRTALRGMPGRRLAAIALGACTVLGCRTMLQNFPSSWDRHVDAQEKAGTVHVGVQAVAPFDEYVQLLQPSFSLDSKQALEKAIPIVQSLEFRDAAVLSLSAALSLAQTAGETKSTSERTTSRAAGEDETSSSSRSETESRMTGKVQVPELVEKVEKLLDEVARPDFAVAFDPTAQYQAAASLLQNVAVLNSYVKEAAVQRDRIPFVVRLLVSVFPGAKRMPYDVEGTLQFMADAGGPPLVYDAFETDRAWLELIFQDEGLTSTEKEPVETRVDRYFGIAPTGKGEDPLLEQVKDLAKIVVGEIVEERKRCDSDQMDLIPLFATDALEATDRRRTELRARDLGAEIGGSVGSSGLGVSGRSQSESSGSGVGRELHGVLTLAHSETGQLGLRIGASPNDTSYYLAPRTYSVAILAMVKARPLEDFCRRKGKRECDAVVAEIDRQLKDGTTSVDIRGLAESLVGNLDAVVIPCAGGRFSGVVRYRHALSGLELVPPDVESLRELHARSVTRHLGSQWATNSTLVGNSLQHALGGDWRAFQRHWDVAKSSVAVITNLWVESQRLVRSAGIQSGRFEVPARYLDEFRDPRGRDDHSRLVLYDDGETKSYFELGGGIFSAPARIDATLFLERDDEETFTIESTSTTRGTTGWRFAFPTLAPFLKPKSGAAPRGSSPAATGDGPGKTSEDKPKGDSIAGLDAAVRIYRPSTRWKRIDDSYRVETYKTVRVMTTKAPKPEPVAKLRATQTQIAVKPDGLGELQVELSGKDAKTGAVEVRLSFEGGIVQSISSGGSEVVAGSAFEYKVATERRYLVKLSGLIAGTTLKVRASQVTGEGSIEMPDTQIALTAAAAAPKGATPAKGEGKEDS